MNKGHVVEGVVSVGNMGKLVAAGKCGLWWGIAKVFFGGDKKTPHLIRSAENIGF